MRACSAARRTLDARRGDREQFKGRGDGWLWQGADRAAWELADVTAEEKLMALALVRSRGDVDQAVAMCGEITASRARRHAIILVELGHARRDGDRVIIRPS